MLSPFTRMTADSRPRDAPRPAGCRPAVRPLARPPPRDRRARLAKATRRPGTGRGAADRTLRPGDRSDRRGLRGDRVAVLGTGPDARIVAGVRADAGTAARAAPTIERADPPSACTSERPRLTAGTVGGRPIGPSMVVRRVCPDPVARAADRRIAEGKEPGPAVGAAPRAISAFLGDARHTGWHRDLDPPARHVARRDAVDAGAVDRVRVRGRPATDAVWARRDRRPRPGPRCVARSPARTDLCPD